MDSPFSILALLGPTASGKSALAMQLADRWKAEILSVDSMQVYRGMDIGTAKPSAGERLQVVHHGIDLVNPDETFTAARFVEQGDQVIARARERGVRLIAAGGTPLYYKALFQGLFEGPGENPELRRHLKLLTSEQLRERLLAADPQAADRIHRNDTRRMVRALEVFELTGRPISSLQTDWQRSARRYEAVWVGLNWPRETINRRINTRVKGMLEAGWVEETRGLVKRYGNLSKTAAEATGYRQLIEHLDGRRNLEETAERIKIATRQLARRQMKWFRRFEDVHWLEGSDDVERLADRMVDLCKGRLNY